MGKDEIKKFVYPEGSLVCWVPGYAKRDLPDDDATAAIVVGLLDCQAAVPEPEYTGAVRNMTGRYEGTHAACCINQAGRHMEIWYSNADGERRLYRYGADFEDASGVFGIFELGDPSAFGGSRGTPVGWLGIISRLEFRIDWADGTGGKYRRFSKRATLSDRAVLQVREAGIDTKHSLIAGWLEDEHRPVRMSGLKQLLAFLTGSDFEQLLQSLFKLDVDGSNLNRDEVGHAIKHIMQAIADRTRQLPPYNTEAGGEIVFPSIDKLKVRAHVLPRLLSSAANLLSHTGRVERRTLYDWLQRVLYYSKEYTNAAPSPYPIIQWLGVPYPQPYRYRVEGAFEIFGLDAALPFAEKLAKYAAKAKEFGGKVTSKIIKKVKEVGGKWAKEIDEKKVKKVVFDKVGKAIEEALTLHAGVKFFSGAIKITPPDGSWEATYAAFAIVAAAGTGGTQAGNESMTAKGWAETGVEWKPEAFSGHITVLPGLLSTDPSGQRADKQMIWLLHGSGTAPETMLVFDEVETDASDLDLGWGNGGIVDLDSDDIIRMKIPDAPMFDYAIEYKADSTIHFQLGSATVRDGARQLLRIFAANELALLRDPYSRVAVEGFADRLGQRWYNQKLSESRSANTHQALADCLGSDLKATLETNGYGEDTLMALGEAFGFPDGKAAPQWRRVFVVMNTQVAATMGTSDSVKKGKRG